MSKTRHFYETEKIRQTDLNRNGFFGESEFGNGNFEVKTILLFINKKRHKLIYMSLYALKQYPISAKTILIGGLGISQPGTFFLHRSPV